LEIRTSTRRLEKILDLIQACRYSLHDLSRVELDRQSPRTPRFNMPFELGLAVAYQSSAGRYKHSWFVFETQKFRFAKSLSDLNGTDPHIHNGTIAGIFGELCDTFRRPDGTPTIDQMWRIYREIRRGVPTALRKYGAGSIFRASVFEDLCVAARAASIHI
jgi:hypothetical protein